MNNLSDLNDILHKQLQRLNNENLQGEALKTEIERSKAIAHTSGQIIQNARLVLDAKQWTVEYGRPSNDLPKMLGEEKNAR